MLSTVILAGGEGTRMRSAKPKVLHPLAGRSLVEHAVRAVAGLAPEHLVVVVGHAREEVGQHVDAIAGRVGYSLSTAVQPEQNGTGDAVACGMTRLPAGLAGTVLVSYGDVPMLDTQTLSVLLAEHERAGNAVTLLTAVPDDPSGYGRIVRDEHGGVQEIVEHGDATSEQLAITEINSGVYAFDAETLTDGLRRLSTENSKGEFYLTDILSIARSAGESVGALVADDAWLTEGVNDRVQLAEVGGELNRRIVRHWQRAGVTVADPASTWIDVEVTLAPDVVIEPGVQLRGVTSVAEGAVIGPDTTLTDVTVGREASVVRTHGYESVIGQGAAVGPFSFLRAGTRLGTDGKIGTFVETKKADIGTGTKVPHLTYVGDATIGEHSNIGASSVFVNYDGAAKHHTSIGSHVRTGSDTMFVAPVTLEDGAYTGAGTVVRRNVPAGALAVSGGAQRNIEGWVERRRPDTPAAEAAKKAQATKQDSETDRESQS